jgi:ABC-type nickel/cobalt efflux system permease component RcnA
MSTTVSQVRTTFKRAIPTGLHFALMWTQGAYYFLTGVWPLVSIETFQMVTGPKTDHLVTGNEADHWLVMTVGVLVTAIGATLLFAAWRKSLSPEVPFLAIASAIALTAIDVIYVTRQVIPPIYLADAAVEVGLIGIWAYVLVFTPRPNRV